MTLLRLLVKSLMGLSEPRSVDGIRKLLTDVRADLYASTLIPGGYLQGLLNPQMVGYPHSTTSGKAQTTAIYVASQSPHGLIELSTLWAETTQQSNAQRLDGHLKNFWKDLVAFPYHRDV